MHRGIKAAALAMVMAMAAASMTAVAGSGPGAVRKQAVASMVITGEIAVDARGYVVSHKVDQVEKVPPGVVGLLAQAVPQWRFEPVVVDGVARPARSKMRVRVVARKQEDGNYSVEFRDADFPGGDRLPGTYASGKRLVPPRYPTDALRRGASAAVFVVVKVGPDGRAQDAVAEQVNLPFVASEMVMEGYRRVFGEAAVSAAMKSLFNPPTVGEDVGKPTSVRIPYQFQLDGGNPVDVPYGKWASYVPGPFQPAPWRVGELGGSPDLMATGGGAQPLDGPGGLRLLTTLGGGG